MEDDNLQVRLYVLCNVKQAKEVKTWLEAENALFKGEKIKSAVYRHADIDENRDLTLVPTTAIVPNDTFIYDGFTTTLKKAAGLASLTLNLKKLSKPTCDSVNGRFYTTTILNPAPNTVSKKMTSTMPKIIGNNSGASSRSSNKPAGLNAMQKSFMTFLRMPSTYGVLDDTNMNTDESQHLSFRQLTTEMPKRWTLYAPLVMLPPGSFSKQWQRLLANSFEGDRNFLWQEILAELSTKEITYTHIAMNKGIQLRNADEEENVIRAPSGDLQLLYGYFGPDIEVERFYLPSDSERIIGEEDFNEAFWVTTTQNGLIQTWAPRWTMFSRGNIKEKARVLNFEKAYTYSKEYKREQQRKARMPAQRVQNKWVSSAERKGTGPQTPLMPQAAGSTMRDAMVVDSPSPRGRSKFSEVIDLGSDSGSAPSPAGVQTASSPFQPREIIDLAAPSPNQVSFGEKQASARPLKPSVQSSNTRHVSYAGSRLRIDGDAPFDRPLPNIPRPPSYSPIEETQSQIPLPPKKYRKSRPHSTIPGQPRLDADGNPRFQEIQLAIDMYAGIGYFTFSYLKLGYDVLAYELNAFSVEGLKRGAMENGFGCTVLRGEDLEFLTSEERRTRDDRDGRWTRGENVVRGHDSRKDRIGAIVPDEKQMVVKGTRIPTVCEGCANGTCAAQQRLANQEKKKAVVACGDAANEVVDDNDDDLWDDSRLDAINRGIVKPIISNENDPIVIDDGDNEPVRAESPLFVSQDGPAPTAGTDNTRTTHIPRPASSTSTPNTTTKVTRSTSASKPAPPQLFYPTLHSIEATLQGQFTRPPQAIVYEANNTTAYQNFLDLSTLSSHRGGNPYRVRHVNLGFLPSTSDAWETSAQLVCSNNEGGFVHVHENVGVDDISAHGEKVRSTFEELCNSYYGDIPERKVELVHTEMVKSYAPGVWHVVYDVKVGDKVPVSRNERSEREHDADYYDAPFDEWPPL